LKYKIIESSYRSWIIEKETGEQYYISFTGRLPRKGNGNFKCTCYQNSIRGKECKHILMIRNYLKTGRKEFDI